MNETRWVAYLSNGQIAIEGVEKYRRIEGELSAWNRLQQNLVKDEVSITGLAIQCDGKTYHLPTNNPKFGGLIPKSFNQYRRFIKDFPMGKTDKKLEFLYNVVEARYKDLILRLTVSENGDGSVWTSLHNIET